MGARSAWHAVVDLSQIDCGHCGGTYAISERVRAYHEEHGSSWHCPYCATGWGYAKGRVQALEQELVRERARVQSALSREAEAIKRATAAEAKEAQAEREAKRLHRRAQAGVCPCCNRTFANVARHMATKHQTTSDAL